MNNKKKALHENLNKTLPDKDTPAARNTPVEEKKDYPGIIFIIIVMAATFLLRSGGPLHARYGLDLSYLFIPALLFLSGQLIVKILNSFFTGPYLDTFKAATIILFTGFSGAALISVPQVPPMYHSFSLPLMFLTVTVAVYRLSEFFFRKLPRQQIILKSILMAISAIFLRGTLHTFWFLGEYQIQIAGDTLYLSIADSLLGGMLFVSACILLSLLKYSDTPRKAALGMWFETSLLGKFLLIALALLYFRDIRPFLDTRYSQNLNYVEWALLIIACIMLLVSISKRVSALVQEVVLPTWKKHSQKVEINAGDDLAATSKIVDNFLQTGDKSSILILIVDLGLRQGLSHRQLKFITRDFTSYQDIGTPGLLTKRKHNNIIKENIQRRTAILNEMVEKLNNAEKRGHHNENRTGTEDM